MSPSTTSRPRLTKQACIAALREVAEHLGTRELDRAVYERARAGMPSPLPHPRTITHVLGCKTWAEALGRAGLKPTAHAMRCRTRPRRKHDARLDDLRAASYATYGDLTPARYAAWLMALPERERVVRSQPRDITRALGSWRAAVEASGIRPDEAFHPAASEHAGDPAWMWTVGDVRRLVRHFVAHHGGRFPTEETWRVRPGGALPPWEVVRDFVPAPQWAGEETAR